MTSTTGPQAPTTSDNTAARIAVENPATGAVIGNVSDMTPDEVAELARRGRAAQPARSPCAPPSG